MVNVSFCMRWSAGALVNWGGGGMDMEEGCMDSCLISAIWYRYKQLTSLEEFYLRQGSAFLAKWRVLEKEMAS